MLTIDHPITPATRADAPLPTARDRRTVDAWLGEAIRHAASLATPAFDARVIRALPWVVPGLALLLGGSVWLIWQLVL